MFDLGFAVTEQELAFFNQIGTALVVSAVFGIIMYVFQSIGLFKMARTLNFNLPWIAWLPFSNTYCFGKIASLYTKRNGKSTAKFGKILLILEIILCVSFISVAATFIIAFMGALEIVLSGMSNIDGGSLTEVAAFVICSAVFAVLLVAYLIIRFVALWRIFAVFSNKNASVLLMVSVLTLGLAAPFCLFAIKNNEPVICGNADTVPKIKNE